MSFEIIGGADEYETAAIIAALQHLLEEDTAAMVQPQPRPVPQPWVLAARVPPSPPPRHQTPGAGESARPS